MNYKIIKSTLLMALTFFLITACNIWRNQPENISRQHSVEITGCRVVEHALGETCIPSTPQRIVALDAALFDILFALEKEESMIGITCHKLEGLDQECYAPGLSSDQLKYLKNIEKVGSSPPSLEKIFFLKPDLIVGFNDLEPVYKQLSDIAPTVLINWEDVKSSFKEYFRRVAQIINQEKTAEELLVQYQNKIEAVQKKLGNRLENAEVSVIIYGYAGEDTFFLPPRNAGCFQILDDLGIKIKSVFSNNREDLFPTNIEVINNYDSDILFIANYRSESGAFLLELPLISTLDAVKNERAYVINGRNIWGAYGPSGINRLLDMLSEKLLDAAQSLKE
jgi:iron complex transport system substrate-binding protein